MGVKWQTAMAGVLVAALIFLVLTFFKVREKIINLIPQTRHSKHPRHNNTINKTQNNKNPPSNLTNTLSPMFKIEAKRRRLTGKQIHIKRVVAVEVARM